MKETNMNEKQNEAEKRTVRILPLVTLTDSLDNLMSLSQYNKKRLYQFVNQYYRVLHARQRGSYC
jgi:hypothetical protein